MTKHREFMVSEDGVHLMNGEFTLCGDAFDIGDTEDEPDAPMMKATKHRAVTCAKCIDIILLCRNVRIKRPDARTGKAVVRREIYRPRGDGDAGRRTEP